MDNIVQVVININTTNSIRQMNLLRSSVQSTANDMSNSLRSIQSSFNNTIKGIAATALAIKGLQIAGEGLYSLFKNGIKVTMDVESAENSIAGLVATLYNIKDVKGNMLQGPEAFTKAVEISRDQVKKLRLDAINTGASFDEVLKGFVQGVGPAASKGFNLDQTRNLTTLVANISKTLLPNKGMVGQEIRSLLTGKIDKNATIGTVLGIGPGGALQQAYKEAMRTGKAYEFLMEKLGPFSDAATRQANSLAGTFDAVKDIFNFFSMDVSSGLVEQLLKVRELLTDIFDKKTGDFNEQFLPAMATLNTIGSLIGNEIINAISYAIDLVKDFGIFIQEDQSLINGIVSGWEATKSVVINLLGIFYDIGGVLLDLGKYIFDGVNVALEGSNEKLTNMQAAMQIIVGFVSAIAVGFAGIRDLIDGAVGAAKILAGYTVKAIGLFVDEPMTVKDLGKNKQGKLDKLGDDIAFKNNKLLERASAEGIINGMTTNIRKSMLDGATNIENAGKKTNKSWSETFDKLKQSGLKTKTDLGTTSAKYEGSNNAKKAKKTNNRSLANAEFAFIKAQLEGEIAILRENAREEESINENNFRNNLISSEEYYRKKKEIRDKDFADQMRLLEQEKKEAQKKATDNPANVEQNKAEAEKIRQKILLLKAKQINSNSDIDRDKVNYNTKIAKETGLDNISNYKLDAEAKMQIDRINQSQLLALKQINQTQSLQIDKDRVEQEYKLELELYEKKKSLGNLTVEEERSLNQEKLAIDRKYSQEKAKIDSEILLNSKKDSIEIQKAFEDNFATLIESLSSGKKSFLDSIKDFAKSIEAEFLRLSSRKIAASIFGDGGDSGGGGIFSSIFGNKTSTGGQSQGSRGGLFGNIFGSIFGGSSSGGGSGGSSSGGFLSGAGSFLSSLFSFDVGTNFVPNDQIAKIHKGEAIIPAKYNPANGAKQQSGAVVNNNFIMSQTPDNRTQLQIATMAGAEVQRAMRRNS